jgi:predicted N-acetyltransferase YhbS
MISFRHAQASDVEAVVQLINAAFQVERFFKVRDRANPGMIRSLMKKGKFLLAEDGPSLAACVYIEVRGERGYLGLLSVDPARQRLGLGRQLVGAAEDFFRGAGCRFSDLQIVNLRQDLPAYYRNLGYVETGTMPFPADEPVKLPAHFIVMSKLLR